MIKKVILFVLLGSFALGHSQPKKTIKCAESFVKGLENRSYNKNYNQFADTLKSIMYFNDFMSLMERIVLSKGEIVRKQVILKEKVKGVSSIFYKLNYEHKDSLIIKLYYNEEDKLIGMRFSPANKQVDYMEPTKYGNTAYLERELSLNTPHGKLKSFLTLPDKIGSSPVVILVHGSGPNDMDESVGNNKMFYDLTLGLIDSGIGTFRYNKRTLTYGSLFSDTATLYSEVIEDVLEAVRLLKKQEGVDTTRIYVLGHSLGAMSAPAIAMLQNDLAGIIMMGSPCRGLWKSVPMQLEYLKEHTSQEITDKNIAEAKKVSSIIELGNYSSSTPKEELFGLSSYYWDALKSNSPSETAFELALPIYVLQGERDYQVNMKDYLCLKDKLSTKKNIKMEVIQGLNHLFVKGTEKSVPAEYENPGNVDLVVIQKIARWIKEGI